MNSRVHPTFKTRYRVANWPEYDRALVQRGDVTVWLSSDAIDAWRGQPTGKRGAQPKFSDLAIETALTLRFVLHLPLRQTEGFVRSLFALMGVELDVPDHTTLSRRSMGLRADLRRVCRGEPVRLVIDSSGLSIVGEGEWAAAKHGGSGRRGWKKLHLGVDTNGEILAQVLTDSFGDDASTGLDLIDRVAGDVETITADAAEHTVAMYEAGVRRGTRVIIPPSRAASISAPMVGPADRILRGLRILGRIELIPPAAQSRNQEGWSMEQFRRFVGLDVHKESVEMAVAEWGREEPRSRGRVSAETRRIIKRIERLGPVEGTLVCYEAGPTGYGLCRALRASGVTCEVIAPSKRPRAPGDKITTDRRDALALARSLRSGDLTPIHVPDPSTEALRDLVRQRDDAKRTERVLKQQLGGFLLRHGRSRSGTNWTGLHLEWIRRLRFEFEPQQCVLEDGLHAVEEATARSERLTAQIGRLVTTSTVADLTTALQALRGFRLVHAATMACEVGDFRRFARPTHLMSFVGLVPSEHSSGATRRRGGITHTGNSHLRRVLVEAAHTYRYPPRMSHDIKKRNALVSGTVRTIAWKAQDRLHQRYKRLCARGKNRQRVITAIARELCGFIWAIGQEHNPRRLTPDHNAHLGDLQRPLSQRSGESSYAL